jgi:hypothetical protein
MERTLLLCTAAFAALAAAAQNDCQNAMVVTASTYVINTIDGQPTTLSCVGGQLATAAEWYAYTPTSNHALTVTTDLPVNAGRDTRFHVFTGTCGNLVCISGDDDSGSGLLSVATFNVTAGTTYRIVFDNRWESNGFVFRLTEMPPVENLVSFTPSPLPAVGQVMCVVDMNGDQLDDAVRVSSTVVHVYQQLPQGGFQHVQMPTPQAAHTPSWSIAAGDLDGNGRNDLFYGGGSGTAFMLQNAAGTAFTQISGPQYVFSQRTNFIDINNDGHLDAFVCHDVQANVYYMNDGNGGVTFQQGGLGDTPDGGNYGSIWIDYDNDGDMDLFIAKCRGGDSPANINQMHRNNGNGTYTEVGPELGLNDNIQTWSSAWGDFDNDGDLDVMIGASSFVNGGHKLLRNDGNGVFTNITAGSGIDGNSALSIEHITHDFNNDGWLDIFSGGGFIWMNNGDLTFTPSPVPMNNGPVGDLNNDGFLDVVNGNQVFFNDGNANNWIKIHTVGTVSNTNGIGARATITSAMGSQIREVRSGDGFAFMSSLTLHFGLGQDSQVDELVIRWPSGVVDTLHNVAANSSIQVIEGSTTGLGIAGMVPADLRVHPSPAIDVLHVQGSQVRSGQIVQVLDMGGRIVLESALRDGVLDITRLPSGIYTLRMQLPQHGVVTRRFSKY